MVFCIDRKNVCRLLQLNRVSVTARCVLELVNGVVLDMRRQCSCDSARPAYFIKNARTVGVTGWGAFVLGKDEPVSG